MVNTVGVTAFAAQDAEKTETETPATATDLPAEPSPARTGLK